VANGIRLTGHAGLQESMTETQNVQVSLLLAHADKHHRPAIDIALRGEPMMARGCWTGGRRSNAVGFYRTPVANQ